MEKKVGKDGRKGWEGWKKRLGRMEEKVGMDEGEGLDG